MYYIFYLKLVIYTYVGIVEIGSALVDIWDDFWSANDWHDVVLLIGIWFLILFGITAVFHAYGIL